METGTLIALGSLLVTMIGGFWGVIKYLLSVINLESAERRRLIEKLFDRLESMTSKQNEMFNEHDEVIDGVRDRLIKLRQYRK